MLHHVDNYIICLLCIFNPMQIEFLVFMKQRVMEHIEKYLYFCGNIEIT